MIESIVGAIVGISIGLFMIYILAHNSYKQGKSGGKIRDDYDPTELGADTKDYLNPEFDDSEDVDRVVRRITNGSIIYLTVFGFIVWFSYDTNSLSAGTIILFTIAFMATLPPYLAGGFVALGVAKNNKEEKE